MGFVIKVEKSRNSSCHLRGGGDPQMAAKPPKELDCHRLHMRKACKTWIIAFARMAGGAPHNNATFLR
jgi:hypothetical protein